MNPRCSACGNVITESNSESTCAACLLEVGLKGGEDSPASPIRNSREVLNFPAIARYQPFEIIGSGSSGIVYRAWDPLLHREVALKTLHARFVGQELQTQRQRLSNEATLIARLDHPGIVPLHDHGELDGIPWLVQRLFPKGDLAKVLDQGVPIPTAAAWLHDLAGAVAEAHRQGVLHRDIKPSNVFLDEHGQVFLGDFGIARSMSDTTVARTVAGFAVGTPGYMAPEQVAGHPDGIGPAADIHGLGALLYHALTGSPPFKGATFESVIRQVVEEDPLPPHRLNPMIPRDLEAICLKCLEKAPAQRYRNALALRDDLARFIANQPVAAKPLSRVGRFCKWSRRHPLTAAMAFALGLSLATGLTAITVATVRLAEANRRQATNRDRYAFEMFDRWTNEHESRQGLDAMAAILGDSPRHIAAIRRAWSVLDQRQIPLPLAELEVSTSLLGAFDDTGERVVVLTKDSRLVICNVRDGRVLGESPIPARSDSRRVGFSPAGDLVWLQDVNGSVRAWTLADWKPSAPVNSENWIPREPPLPPGVASEKHLAHFLSPDGRRVVLVGENRSYELRDVTSGKVLNPAGSTGVIDGFQPFPSRSTKPLLMANAYHRLLFYDPETGSRFGNPVDMGLMIETACWDPSGHRVLVIPVKGHPVIFEAPRSAPAVPLASFGSFLKQMAYAPDGHRIVLSTVNKGVHVVESGSLQEPDATKAILAGCRWAEWSGPRLLAVRPDGQALFVNPDSGLVSEAFKSTPPFMRLAVTRDGQRAATLSSQGIIEVWNLAGATPTKLCSGSFIPPMVPIQEMGRDIIFGFGFDSRGTRLAVTFNTGYVDVWSIPRMGRISLQGSETPSYGWDFHPYEDRFVMACSSGHVLQWDLDAGSQPDSRVVESLPFVQRAVFDPSGRYLLLAAYYGRAMAIRWPPQTEDGAIMIADEDAWQIIAARSEPALAAARASGLVELRGLPEPLVHARWKLPASGQFNHLAFSPDGARLAMGSNGSEIFEVSFPPADQSPPEWFLEWVQTMGQENIRIDPGGTNSVVRRIIALRRRMASLQGNGFWERWGRTLSLPTGP